MRVLLTGGGSGGSAAPVIAVGEALRSQLPGSAFLYLGTTAGPEQLLVREAGFPFVGIRAGRLRRYATLRNLALPLLVAAGLMHAGQLVRDFRPDVAFGAGGFATVPPLVAARLQRVPIGIHQQDVIPGLANRFLAPLAAQVTVALPETRGAFRRPSCVLGNPARAVVLRGNADRARQCLGLDPGLPVVLVTGGGTGAVRLNEIAVQAARDLVDVCSIVHLTGAGKAVSGWTHPRYHQREFLAAGMADALAAADLVVSRAGMSALTEIAALGKAAILVPMPSSHQEANAAALSHRGAARSMPEPTLTGPILAAEVRALLNDPVQRRSLGEAAARALPSGAAERIAACLAQLPHLAEVGQLL